MANVELARKVLAHIEALEARKAAGEKLCEHWDQSDWGYHVSEDAPENTRNVYHVGDICGTAMCFAGWACRLAGEELVLKPAIYSGYSRWDVAGRTETIATRAAELLDLPPSDYGDYGDHRDVRIFSAYNTLDDLRAMVAGLEDGTYNSIVPSGEDDDE